MTTKKNDEKTFNNYLRIAKQLCVNDKPIPKEILKYKYNKGSIAHILSTCFINWQSSDKEILIIRDEFDNTVAHILSIYSDEPPYWFTDDKEILILRNKKGNTVAHFLAEFHSCWFTTDSEILCLKDSKNQTVKEILNKKLKLIRGV